MENFKVGDTVLRKGRECKITHIDNALQPPSFTVLMLDTNTEVGTELSRLSKIQTLPKSMTRRKKNKKKNKKKRISGLQGRYKK